MPTAPNKDRIYITLEKTILKDIRLYAKKNNTTVSRIVETLLKGEMDTNEKKIIKWITTK